LKWAAGEALSPSSLEAHAAVLATVNRGFQPSALAVASIRSPDAPAWLGRLDLGAHAVGLHGGADNVLVVATAPTCELQPPVVGEHALVSVEVDVSTAGDPVVAHELGLPGRPAGITVAGNTIYVLTEQSLEVISIDASGWLNTVASFPDIRRGSGTGCSPMFLEPVDAAEGMLVVATDSEVTAFDISNPNTPRPWFQIAMSAYSVSTNGDRVYAVSSVGGGLSELTVVRADRAATGRGMVQSRYRPPAWITAVQATGDSVAVATNWAGILWLEEAAATATSLWLPRVDNRP
jgi:hypothetical protein